MIVDLDSHSTFCALFFSSTTQAEPAYCGVSTLVMVLNALAVDPRKTWKGPWRWYTESMLNCCVDLDEMKETGISLRTFACLARCQGVDVTVVYASDSTLDDFRNAVRLACVEDISPSEDTVGPFLVASYNRKALQQTGTGHFSPIAAYDEESDMSLVCDTARFKYGAHWVPLPLLFEAMSSEDPETGRSRGYVLMSFHEDEEHSSMPQSLLFQTRQTDHAVQQRYKEFLEGLNETPLSWEDARSYWTQGGTNSEYIWQLTKPQLNPTEDKDHEAVISIRKLINDLIPESNLSPASLDNEYCGRNASRTICLDPLEAVYVVYLASLDPETRKEVVDAVDSNEPLGTKQQLLAEAELLQLAIEMSDELSIDSNE